VAPTATVQVAQGEWALSVASVVEEVSGL
jgi:hypothetical protein